MQIGFEARLDRISGLEKGDGPCDSGTYFQAHFFEGMGGGLKVASGLITRKRSLRISPFRAFSLEQKNY